MERSSVQRRFPPSLARVPGAIPASRPGFTEPCLPTLRRDAPAGAGWIHEIDYDGRRIQAHVVAGRPVLLADDGTDCSNAFHSIVQGLQLLPAREAVLDGVVVVLDERGAADPDALQRDVDVGRTDGLACFVFDLLYLDGFDLRSVPLIERKGLLSHLLGAIPMRSVRFAGHVEADGPAVIEHARDMPIAGILSRKRESAYRGGVQDTWVRVRCAKHGKPVRQDLEDAFSERRVVAPSKEQLAAYWTRVAHRALKYLAHRPLEPVCDPPGPLPVLPGSVHLMRPKGFLGDTIPPVWIEDLDGLLGLVAIGALELHAWNCTVEDQDHPNVLVFDVEALEWHAATKAALALRKLLAEDGLASWPKLTGTHGLQVMVPLDSPVTYDLAQRYSAAMAKRVLTRNPAWNGQLFIHTEGNYRTRTSIAPYSPRARPGFPIAVPVSWRRIQHGIRPDAFAMTHPFHAS